MQFGFIRSSSPIIIAYSPEAFSAKLFQLPARPRLVELRKYFTLVLLVARASAHSFISLLNCPAGAGSCPIMTSIVG